ncbi:phosphatidylinositol-specific phospholipase C [Propionibacteriaceae bacterium Y1700]|uniref:phosphatidylinositol-specific phospholipase C n=1 Tax=Microlunatus sp. Y1700 TaxID=3418487 RepID=UPI003DA79596
MTFSRRDLLLGSLGASTVALGLSGAGTLAPSLARAATPTATSWTRAIDGHRSLASLTIPGTHDTCALNYTPFVRCQSYGPRDQLKMGVRFFDLRPADEPDMPIHHGPVYVDNTMVNVLNGCRSFLKEHPSETVLVLIKQEHTTSSAADFGARWRRTTKPFNDILLTPEKLPTLAEARGKVVVITRAGGVPGVPYSSAVVSDKYEVTSRDNARDVKWPIVRSALNKADSWDSSRSKLHITFCSGNGTPRPWADPGDINEVIEPLLRDWLTKRTARSGERLGVVLVDFAKKAKIEQIAARNFGRNTWA